MIRKLLLSIVILAIPVCSYSDEVVKGALQCDIDLNYDGKLDSVIYLERGGQFDLVALTADGATYKAHLLDSTKSRMQLSCNYGGEVIETASGKGKSTNRTVSTGGSYILLVQPEGSAVAYFFRDGKFQTVYTLD